MTSGSPPQGVVDNMFAPEVFTDGPLSFVVHNGIVRVVLSSTRSAQSAAGPGGPSAVVVARLAMPIPAAQQLVLGLFDILKQQGLDPTVALKGGATTQ
jgi:hypothetical protein